MSSVPSPRTLVEQANARHKAWRQALYAVALRAIERGDFSDLNNRTEADQRHNAGIVANYAATDMVLKGRTLLLPMDEVRAADPFADVEQLEAAE